MTNRSKIILVILLTGAAIAAPMAHHWKHKFGATFGDNIPNDKGVNLFDLGQIKDRVDLSDINAPSKEESFVRFNFETEDGQNVSLLMRRLRFERERQEALKIGENDVQKHVKFKQKMGELFGNGKHIAVTAWYRLNPDTNDWKEIYNVADKTGEYRFKPNFDVRFYPNGLAVFHSNGQKPAIFMATGEDVKLSADKTKLEIGNNKEISSDDLVKELKNAQINNEGDLP